MQRINLARPALLLIAGVAVLRLAVPASVARADDAKPEAKEPPDVRIVAPLAVAAGERLTIRLRGAQLGDATAIRIAGPGAEGLMVELKSKGNADGDDATKKAAGDTYVECELTVPTAPLPSDQLELIVVTPAGDTPPAAVWILPADQLVSEAEPNGGFRQPQIIAPERCTVRGEIGGEKDVDVFRVTGKAGQTLRAQVLAAARGSMLDAAITVYDARGNVLATVDDPAADSRDPSIELKLPADGDYYLVLTDANDRGGATHPYLLGISRS